MTPTTSSEQQIARDISAMQARELLALLDAHLAPADCLQRAAMLSKQQSDTGAVIRQLDTADVSTAMQGNLLAYRRYVKGSILGTLRGIDKLAVRHDYIVALKENVALHMGALKDAGTDAAAALRVAEEAILNRDMTRKMFAAHGARTYAQIQSEGLSVWWKGAKSLVMGPAKDKHSFEALALKAANNADYRKLTSEQQVDVLRKIVENSGKPGTLSTAWKVVTGTAATVQMTIDLLLIIEETRQARDPLRVVTANAVRLGTAVALTTATEGAVVAVVGALAIGSGVGLLVVAGGMAASHVIGSWVNTTIMNYYDEINPRIADVMRDLSWEPDSLITSLSGPAATMSMTEDLKYSMIEAA